MRILTVCLGNICRSPAAAAAIEEAAQKAGVELEVGSAGTGSWHIGQPPHPEAVAAGARAGLRIDGRARRVTPSDFERYDVILAMDRSNLRELADMAPSKALRAKLRLFRTYDPASDEDEIPDPWGGPSEGYEETIVMVRAAAKGLVDDLLARSQLE